MFSLQEMLNSQMLSGLVQPSISTPQQNFCGFNSCITETLLLNLKTVLAVPFNAQLYVLMNAHLQNMLNTMPRVEKMKAESEDDQVSSI